VVLDPDAVAAAYFDFMHGDFGVLKGLLSEDFYDNVSGRTGQDIFDVVALWLRESFTDLSVEHHGTGLDGARVMLWFTVHATHVGSAFPWLRGRPASGKRVAWAQLHVLRTEGECIVEHWAVRDDLRVLEAIDS